jgi:hypothetical protein
MHGTSHGWQAWTQYDWVIRPYTVRSVLNVLTVGCSPAYRTVPARPSAQDARAFYARKSLLPGFCMARWWEAGRGMVRLVNPPEGFVAEGAPSL